MKDLFEPREKRPQKYLRGIVSTLLYITKTGVLMANAPRRFHSAANSLPLFLENGNKKESLKS